MTTTSLQRPTETALDRASAIFAEPYPRSTVPPLNLKIEGDVSLRDDLDVQDGQEVTIVLTARISRIDVTSGDVLFTARVLAVNSVEGEDVVSGPGAEQQLRIDEEARIAYFARRQAAREILSGQNA